MTGRHQDKYGQWAGNPNGQKADLARCAQSVTPKGEWVSRQCSRARGFGPDQAYCKIHAKRYQEEREE